MGLIVLFLQYDTEKYPGSLLYLEKYLKTIRQHSVNKIVIIDNKKEEDSLEIIDNCKVKIGGDNSHWEFSGWNKGLELIKTMKLSYDAILFVNDSFQNPAFISPTRIICDESISRCIGEKALLGARGGSGKDLFFIGTYNLYTWVRTHCFMMEKSVIKIVKDLITFHRPFIDMATLSKVEPPYFSDTQAISNNLKNKIINWLYEGGTWHSAFKFEDDPELFKMKSLAYLNELGLTARAEKSRIATIKLD